MKIQVAYSIEHDIKNYCNSVYKFAWLHHGQLNLHQNLLESLPKNIQVGLLKAKNELEAKEIINNYLVEDFVNKSKIYKKISKDLEKILNVNQVMIKNTLKELYNKELPCFKIQIYLTSIMINTYDPINQWILVYYKMPLNRQIDTIVHELNHFMYHYCFGYLRESIGIEKWESLKEALTIFTDPPYKKGYPAQQKLREWLKSQKRTIPEIIKSGDWKKYI